MVEEAQEEVVAQVAQEVVILLHTPTPLHRDHTPGTLTVTIIPLQVIAT